VIAFAAPFSTIATDAATSASCFFFVVVLGVHVGELQLAPPNASALMRVAPNSALRTSILSASGAEMPTYTASAFGSVKPLPSRCATAHHSRSGSFDEAPQSTSFQEPVERLALRGVRAPRVEALLRERGGRDRSNRGPRRPRAAGP